MRMMKIRNFLFIMMFAVLFSGCMGSKPSLQISQAMQKAGVSKEQVCKGANKWIKLSKRYGCNIFFTPDMEDIQKGVVFKKFETSCEKLKGRLYFGEFDGQRNTYMCYMPRTSDFKSRYVYAVNEKEFFSDIQKFEAKEKAKNLAKNKALREAKMAAKKRAEKQLQEKMAREAKEKADKEAKAEAVKLDIQEAKERMQILGISSKEVRDTIRSSAGFFGLSAYGIKENAPITNAQMDRYLQIKKRQKQEAEFEQKAKIKKGKQYICSDGYDSWVLKYNGSMITFGEVNFKQTFGGGYVQNRYDKTPLYIDRLKATVTYNGNVSYCVKR